jgi:DNA polymerase III epsilon subunit-like protein
MKILVLDIETAPNHAYVWSIWKEICSTDFITDEWYILCWCAKWLGESKIYKGSLHDCKDYKVGFNNDKEILIPLHKLLDEADIVIAHNGLRFDCKKIRARFIYHGITPPSPFRVIDTLCAAKATFAFTSNRLDDLGKFLKVGKKVDTGGFKLWKGCMNGIEACWKKLLKYCSNDVKLLERVYLKIRPYLKQHPNLGIYSDENRAVCPTCGSKKIRYSGHAFTQSGKFRRFQCMSCHKWARDTENLLTKKKKATHTTNIT